MIENCGTNVFFGTFVTFGRRSEGEGGCSKVWQRPNTAIESSREKPGFCERALQVMLVNQNHGPEIIFSVLKKYCSLTSKPQFSALHVLWEM